MRKVCGVSLFFLWCVKNASFDQSGGELFTSKLMNAAAETGRERRSGRAGYDRKRCVYVIETQGEGRGGWNWWDSKHIYNHVGPQSCWGGRGKGNSVREPGTLSLGHDVWRGGAA